MEERKGGEGMSEYDNEYLYGLERRIDQLEQRLDKAEDLARVALECLEYLTVQTEPHQQSRQQADQYTRLSALQEGL